MKQYALRDDFAIQLDVKEINDKFVRINFYTGVLCPEVIMKRDDYDFLVHKGFFVRPGDAPDSADVLNTTELYRLPVVSIIQEA